MKSIKCFIAMLLAVCVLSAGAVYAAQTGGASDPLVSVSYLLETVKAAILSDASDSADTKLGAIAAGYKDRLEAIEPEKREGFEKTASAVCIELSDGQSVTIDALSMIIPVSGKTVLRILSGEVIDITTGRTVSSPAVLSLYHKYFAAENSRFTVQAYSNDFSAQAEGYYMLNSEDTVPAGEMFYDTFGHWGAEYIARLYSLGVVNGTDDHVFQPDAKVTRGMLVTVLGRMYGVNTELYKTSGFSDVDINMWYGPYVEWAKLAGIVDGFEDGTFKPEQYITREQMALIIMRFAVGMGAQLEESEGELFADSSLISPWAYDAVEFTRKTGLLTGKDGNIFDPAGTATRAEICTVTSRLIDKTGMKIQ